MSEKTSPNLAKGPEFKTVTIGGCETMLIEGKDGQPDVYGFENHNQPGPETIIRGGVYGLEDPYKNIAIKQELYPDGAINQWADTLVKTLEQVTTESKSPMVVQGRDGVAYIDSPTHPQRVAVFSKNKPDAPFSSARYAGDTEPVGVFTPEENDLILIANVETLDAMMNDLPNAATYFKEVMDEQKTAFVAVEVTPSMTKAIRAGAAHRKILDDRKNKHKSTAGPAHTPAAERISRNTKKQNAKNQVTQNALVGVMPPDARPTGQYTQPLGPDYIVPGARPAGQYDKPIGPDVQFKKHDFIGSDEYKEALENYNKSDQELAKRMSKRIKVGAFSLKKTRESLSESVEGSLTEYEKMAEIFDNIEIKKWQAINPLIGDGEIANKLAKYHEAKQRLHNMRRQNEIRQTTGGKFGKLSEWNERGQQWYAGLSKRAKVGFGLGAAAVGAGAGLVLGAAGFVGGALLIGAKTYKTYAQNRSGIYGAAESVDSFSSTTPIFENGRVVKGLRSREDIRNGASLSFRRDIETSINKTDKVNQKTKLMTIGAVALFGVGGVMKIAEHADDIKGGWNNIFGPHDQTPESAPKPPAEEFLNDNPSGREYHMGDYHKAPEVAPPEAPSYDWSPEASTISNGEGLYQQFGQMGITDPNAQYALLHNPSLMNELYSQGFVYPDASIGGWGINMPAGGVMPQNALDTIARYATSSGYTLAA